MLFGATPFASTTFAGVGSQNVVVLVNGKRVNISVGNSTVGFGTRPSGNGFKLANGTVNVVSCRSSADIEFFDEFKIRVNDYRREIRYLGYNN